MANKFSILNDLSLQKGFHYTNKFESPLLMGVLHQVWSDDGYGEEVKRRTDRRTSDKVFRKAHLNFHLR